MSLVFRALRVLIASLCFTLLFGHSASGQVLLRDDFEVDGLVDQSIWRLPFGGDGAFFGRTEVKTDLSQHYPTVANGVATLELDTFNPSLNGSHPFLGAELHTKRNFAVGGGLRYEVRARVVDPVPGLTGGLFLYDVQRENRSGLLVRDEIDHELLTNDINRSFTNYWNDGSFTGPDAAGDGSVVDPAAGFDLTEFHDYRVDWLPNRIDWFIDGERVRSQTSNVPDDPVQFRANLWAPDLHFEQAFSADLQPATSAADNVTYRLELDSVEITQLNTTVSDNLLLDSSFEDPDMPFFNLSDGGIVDTAATGQWVAFNNVGFENRLSNSGERSLALWGPFSGRPDASGIFQNVDASPGEVFEASVFAQTEFTNSIYDEANFTTIKVEFLDINGDVIPGLDEFIGANGKESIILEGRDPNVPEDVWVERQVSAIAPAGTDKARISLAFVQLENGGGAVLFDDLSLVRLSADIAPGLTCDFDGDGQCDSADLDVLYAAFGDSGGQFDVDGNGAVDAGDINGWLVAASDSSNPALANPTDTLVLGDVNLDGDIDSTDLGLLLNSFGSTTVGWSGGDLNGDQSVDSTDLGLLLNNFGHASAVAVPEPDAPIFVLLVGGMGIALCRRKSVSLG